MVVLDEPNSNLDSAGDAALARALAHAKREKLTVITIAQRPSLLALRGQDPARSPTAPCRCSAIARRFWQRSRHAA